MIAVMLVVGFVGFTQTSEAGPLRNLVNRVQNREFRPVQNVVCGVANVVHDARPGWVVPKVEYVQSAPVVSSGSCNSCGVQSVPQVVNNTVWSTPSDGRSFQTPVRNAVYNVLGCPGGVCPPR